jgi:uncharacterized short protein YbdD (DUF466 family)
MSGFGELVARAARTLSFMIGAPDYDRYLQHMRSRHPNAEPLTRAEFVSQRMNDRYAKAGSRCC